MWIFTSKAFLSIVAHRTKPDVLLVRARRAGDIQAVFPKAKVKRTPAADYRFRAEISRWHVQAAIGAAASDIDYDNFKASVKDLERHNACVEVWTTMKRYQDQLARPRRR